MREDLDFMNRFYVHFTKPSAIWGRVRCLVKVNDRKIHAVNAHISTSRLCQSGACVENGSSLQQTLRFTHSADKLTPEDEEHESVSPTVISSQDRSALTHQIRPSSVHSPIRWSCLRRGLLSLKIGPFLFYNQSM